MKFMQWMMCIAMALALAATAVGQDSVPPAPPAPQEAPKAAPQVSPEAQQLQALYEAYQQRKARRESIEEDAKIVTEMTDSDLLLPEEKAYAWQLFLQIYPDAPPELRDQAIAKAQQWTAAAQAVSGAAEPEMAEQAASLWNIYAQILANPENSEAATLIERAQIVTELPEPFKSDKGALADQFAKMRDQLAVLRALSNSSPLFQERLDEYIESLKEIGIDVHTIEQIEKTYGVDVAQLYVINRIDLIEQALPKDENATQEQRRMIIADLIPYVFGATNQHPQPAAEEPQTPEE
ncbi:hypothetical protein KQI84_07190 [bacterium]|nr:hypothetical protein [bacterium]